MSRSDIFRSQPQSLARMMDAEAGDQGTWTSEELGAILEHLLSSPVEFDLSTIDPALPQRIDALQSPQGPPIRTFRDLLEHPDPPIELLELTRRFAKHCRQRNNRLLPDEVAGVLYVWSIMVARLRLGRRISSVDDASLAQNIEWALRHAWLDRSARALFESGLPLE